MEKATLTLYTAIGDHSRIPAAILDRFRTVTQSVTTDDDRTTLILQDDTQLIFHFSNLDNKPDFIALHTDGMANYFDRAETPNTTLKQNVLRQIRCFTSVTGITFETDDNDDRTNYIVNTLYDIAREAQGFLLYPNMRIYNGEGQLVLSAKGESELDTFTPIANTDLLDADRPAPTQADTQRYERSIATLRQQGIPYLEHLHSALTESETVLRSRQEMLQRATALFAVAVYSEVMLSDDPDREEALNYVRKLEDIYNIGSWITPAEATYISTPEPEQAQCIQAVWRYECCAVLLWAAGIIEELPYPSDICDVPVIATLFWQHQSLDELLSKGIARSATEIADAADLTLRYDWACVDARVNGLPAPASLDGGIVMERHYTFNWITGANDQADWDDTDPNT